MYLTSFAQSAALDLVFYVLYLVGLVIRLSTTNVSGRGNRSGNSIKGLLMRKLNILTVTFDMPAPGAKLSFPVKDFTIGPDGSLTFVIDVQTNIGVEVVPITYPSEQWTEVRFVKGAAHD